MNAQPSKLAGALAAEERKLLACVHCGLCLEACPTYVHTGDENDSPRGRLYLMRAAEEGRLRADSEAFSRHIDRCLGCRACESACPAGVEYGKLLEAARSDLADAGRRRGWTARLLRLLLRHVWLRPARLRLAFTAARLFRDSRLPRLLLGTRASKLLPGRLEFALALLDASAPARRRTADGGLRSEEGGTAVADVESDVRDESAISNPPSAMSEAGRALLFGGCVTEGLFARVNRATARVLAANGWRVETPRGQVCCGALHAHAGDLEGARRLARQNVDAFEHEDGAAVVTNAGGCGAMLLDYAHLLGGDAEYAERARRFSKRVRDVSQQLAPESPTGGAPEGPRRGAPLAAARVTYDASCHLLHGQRAAVEPLRVVGAVPGLEHVPLAGSDVCCGGAGVYNLAEPELSERVLAEKLARVAETGAPLLATGNPGCHMQIGAGARLAGLRLEVCHPVELLDESYRRAGFYAGEADADRQDVQNDAAGAR